MHILPGDVKKIRKKTARGVTKGGKSPLDSPKSSEDQRPEDQRPEDQRPESWEHRERDTKSHEVARVPCDEPVAEGTADVMRVVDE